MSHLTNSTYNMQNHKLTEQQLDISNNIISNNIISNNILKIIDIEFLSNVEPCQTENEVLLPHRDWCWIVFTFRPQQRSEKTLWVINCFLPNSPSSTDETTPCSYFCSRCLSSYNLWFHQSGHFVRTRHIANTEYTHSYFIRIPFANRQLLPQNYHEKRHPLTLLS